MTNLAETLTNMADLLSDISSDVREIPHGQKTIEARPLLCLLDEGVDGENR